MTQTLLRRLARSIKPVWLVLVLMLAYSVYFSSFSIRKHAAFQTSGYDLSFFVQALWNTLHGEMLRRRFSLARCAIFRFTLLRPYCC